ncbi:prepilin peptidase [Azospirillum sp. SYSU D00513]|uniref:A24 family peptidase n=1 Tax=Azospirillum sp. SYSU D00513 TaxID=2812561 RepID=UPI001A96579E|nr:prepilin peptidase [Azospirillum sp. SYSU D00513]
MIATLLLTVLAASLAVAMVSDLRTMEIPDGVSVALVAAFLVGGLAGGAAWTVLLAHAGAGLAVFLAGVLLHRAGLWGGGDVKLGAVLALWFGWGALPAWGLAVSLIGGVLTLALLALRRRPLTAGAPSWLARLATPGEGVPYGVAIGGGALVNWNEALRFLPAS